MKQRNTWADEEESDTSSSPSSLSVPTSSTKSSDTTLGDSENHLQQHNSNNTLYQTILCQSKDKYEDYIRGVVKFEWRMVAASTGAHFLSLV